MKKLDDETYRALGMPLPYEAPKMPEGMLAKIGDPIAALKSAPDIAFYQPDEFYRLYTKWFETTRRDALRAANERDAGPGYNGGDTPPI